MTTIVFADGQRISFLGAKDCATLGVTSRATPTLKGNILSLEQDEIETLRQAELLEEIEGVEDPDEELVGSEAYKN